MAYSDLKESTKCYDDIRVTTENLRRNGEKQLKTIDGRISLIKEFFKSQSYENMELRDIIDLYERFSSLQTAINTPPHSEISKYFDIVSVPEKVELCKCISECISYDSEIYESLSDIGEHCHDDARGKTAYMKNDFTDSAYELFSKAIDFRLPEEGHIRFCDTNVARIHYFVPRGDIIETDQDHGSTPRKSAKVAYRCQGHDILF